MEEQTPQYSKDFDKAMKLESLLRSVGSPEELARLLIENRKRAKARKQGEEEERQATRSPAKSQDRGAQKRELHSAVQSKCPEEDRQNVPVQ